MARRESRHKAAQANARRLKYGVGHAANARPSESISLSGLQEERPHEIRQGTPIIAGKEAHCIQAQDWSFALAILWLHYYVATSER